MRTGGAKPCRRRCSANRFWMATAHEMAAVRTDQRADGFVVPSDDVLPRFVADGSDEVRRADDVREHERSHDAPSGLGALFGADHLVRSFGLKSSAKTL